jgi:septum formation topological specificity factor MinE
MLETLRIKIFGHQPVAKVSDELLDKVINREYGNQADIVRQKLELVISDSGDGKNRISAAIIRLANKDINVIDHYVSVANNDYRDVLSQAEYPRCSKISFQKMGEQDIKSTYIDDWKEYSNWLNS